jgi:enoyl-CoA hydratase
MSILDRTFQNLRTELTHDVLIVTLDRPQRLNAVDALLHRELAEVFAALRDLDSVGAVVITGAGRAFCAGGDARWFLNASEEDIDRMFVEARHIIHDLIDVQQPVIAAVDGPAVGFGATLALSCDLVIASETAVFADPHVSMGVVAGDGGAVMWPLLVGLSRAKQYLMTGDEMDAVEAERIGLINQVVPPGETLKTATALASRLATGPRRAIAGTKQTLNQFVRQAVALAFETGMALERETMRSSDHREAVVAFREGRSPRFTGR